MARAGRIIRWSSVVAALMLAGLSSLLAAPPYDAVKAWESFDFTRRRIQPEQLKSLSLDELKIVRGVVFGRHGRVFREMAIQEYLKSRPWYRPNPKYRPSMLNDTERKNLDLIREAEAKRHKRIEPGDLRFYRDRTLSESELGYHTHAEWRILLAEVEAIHGKTFDAEPWLQQYFEERYWYQPSKKYAPKQLSEIERKNLAILMDAYKRHRQIRLSPGDMGLFQERLITEEMLHGLSLYELRLLRNEVYARRGQRFHTGWIQDYFNQQHWYEPLPDFREPKLSAPEIKNIATIVKYERELHEELSTRPISPELLKGLFLEDARKLRNEIYARHGRVFQRKWLQEYFSSFDWYHPNPNFSEKLLSPVEQKNIAAILAHERTVERAMAAIEA